MSAPRGWDSHIWTDQTTMRLMRANQQQIEIRSNERMPLSLGVPHAVLHFYCPQTPALIGQPVILETSRAVLQLFFYWLYRGTVDTTNWHDVTELYFLGHALKSIALMRSAITEMQKICRDDANDDTELFHYGHISVIDDMVSTSSGLFHYIEDTYFNHWRPSDDEDVNDNPREHQKTNLFFKKLFERSFKEQREGANCSCCHDYCKYHDHESEAERLATCGRDTALASTSKHQESTTPISKPAQAQRRARKSRSSGHGLIANQDFSSMDEDDLPLRVVRASAPRAGTPKRNKPSAETWLKVRSHAPVDYPADYHAKLTSLPLVNAIKVRNWLETGLEAEGVQQLQEPDRVIAAAMSWTAEEYAQTKCIFFEQYATAMQPGMQRHTMEHWRNTLKFGGNKPKERAERLLAMWESLGWLREQHYNSTDASQDPRTPMNATHHDEDLLMTDLSHNAGSFINTWSEEEIEAMIEIMEGISADSSLAKLDFRHQTAIASERLKAQHEYERTPKAINHQWHRQQSRRGAARKARSWTEREDKALIDILGGLEHTEVAKTKKRFDVCSQRLLADHNIVRTTAACMARSQRLAHPSQVTANSDVGEDPTSDKPHDDRIPANNDNHDHSAGNKAPPLWTPEEDRFMLASMKEFDADPALVPWSTEKKVAACIQRLKDEFGTDRTSNAVKVRYYRKLRREKEERAKVQEQAEVEAESESKQDPTATGSFASPPQPSIAGKSLDAVINRKRESDADEDGEELQVSKPLSRAKRTRVTKTARSRLIEELFGDEE
ncbi:hypothetical protein M438DRAFT_353813 [Aureobasidium pullulans EXF-150]|uniref:Myb-like domain-containing protein n=1 Tax=Aureobasidium pullulans EXF-150 TaxID=1043002 RepID=A0A074YIK8_AURPU|nr:uncharacterized protein M438DRAFT_353813 [Aureobasidium pullulans EXF-150]KEQ86711.1 hypothetical protein M438DRAFT_353813 [Aureobasidium pullulans EXF-150]